MDREKMISLYQNMSKHSGYQILPEEIQQYLGVDVKTLSRFERERLEYIKKHIDLNDKKVMDIGGNTGYFTFNSIKSGAVHVDYYEGNAVHAEFVEHGKEIYTTERITVFNKYYSFEPTVAEYDLIFCMNVVHHLGDDFFCVKTLEEAKREMMQCVNNLAFSAAVLVFQMGFNWMGNIQKPLFKNGTKK